MNRFLLLFVALFFFQNSSLFAQQQVDPSTFKPYYTQYYKLNKEDIKKILEGKWEMRKELAGRSVFLKTAKGHPATFKRTTDSLGYFLMVDANGYSLSTTMFNVPSYEIRGLQVKSQTWIFPMHVNGEIPYDAKLNYKSASYSIDSSCNCFKIPTDRYPGAFLLDAGREFQYFNLPSLSEYKPAVGRNNWNQQKPRISSGFIVFSQSEYKLMDSVKMKAFLIRQTGKPIGDSVRMILRDARGVQYFSKKMVPQRPGAFEWTGLISDSFNMDMDYYVDFYDLKNRYYPELLLTETFRVTNFQLKKAELKIIPPPLQLTFGSDLPISTFTADANNLPIQDAQLHVRVRVNSLSDFSEPLVHVPISWDTLFYDTTVYLSGHTSNTTTIPLKGLPQSVASLNVFAEIIDGENNRITSYHNVTLIPDDEKIALTKENNVVKINYLHNGKAESGKKVTVSEMINGVYSLIGERTLPLELPYNPLVTSYSVNFSTLSGKSQRSDLQIPIEEVSFDGRKTKDSVFIDLINPGKSEVAWEIRNRGKVLFKGRGTEYNAKLALAVTGAVDVVYTWWRGGVINLRSYTINSRDFDLSISTSLPEIIFPGQKVPVEIVVRDYDGKPSDNCNITAWAVNTQMPVIRPPNIPYYGKLYSNSVSGQHVTVSGVAPRYISAPVLDNAMYSVLKLNDVLSYKLVYESNWALTHYKVPADKTELAVYMVDSFRHVHLPLAVFVDSVLHAMHNEDMLTNEVVGISPGAHKLQLRSYTDYFETQYLQFEKGYKHFIFLRTDNPAKQSDEKIKSLDTTYMIGRKELSKYTDNYLFLNYPYSLRPSEISIVSGERIITMLPNTRKIFDNASKLQFNVIFPVSKGPLTVHLPDTTISFYFDPQLMYEITNDKKLNMYTRFNAYYSAASVDPRQPDYLRSSDSLFIPSTINDTLEIIYERKANTDLLRNIFANKYVEGYSGYDTKNYRSLILQDYQDYPLFTWLINQSDSLCRISYGHTEPYFGELYPGVYDLYFVHQGGKISVVRNIRIDASNMRTYVKARKSLSVIEDAEVVALERRLEEISRKSMSQKMVRGERLSLRPFEYAKVVNYNVERIQSYMPGASLSFKISENAGFADALLIVTTPNGKKLYTRVDDEGRIYLRLMEPGTYDLALISHGHEVYLFNNVKLERGYTVRLLDSGTDTLQAYGRCSLNTSRVHQFTRMRGSVKPIAKNIRIFGKVTDPRGLPVIGVSFSLYRNAQLIGTTFSDTGSIFSFKGLDEGSYEMKIFHPDFRTKYLHSVYVSKSGFLRLDLQLSEKEVFFGHLAEPENRLLPADNIAYEGDQSEEFDYHDKRQKYKDVAVKAEKKMLATQNEVTFNTNASYNLAPSFSGARSSATEYFVDGVQLSGAPDMQVDLEGLDESEEQGNADYKPQYELERMKAVQQDPNVNKVRNDFRNNAYWMPNLWTNAEGRTGFTVVFPDNQTTWMNMIAGIDPKLRTKLYTFNTKAYKPVSASLAVPDFLVEDDSVSFTGRLINYTGKQMNPLTRWNFNGVESSRNMKLDAFSNAMFRERVPQVKDSLEMAFRMDFEGYIDGESRKVKVLKNGIVNKKTQYFYINADTGFTIPASQNALKREILVSSDYKELYFAEIRKLTQYGYGCVEQTASKLYALIYEKKLCAEVKRPFVNERMVVQMIKRLEEFQNNNGSWGWWKNGYENSSLTFYVAGALQKAKEMGYTTYGVPKAAQFMMNKYDRFDPATRVLALQYLNRLGYKFEFKSRVEKLEEERLDKYSQYVLAELKLDLGDSTGVIPVTFDIKGDRGTGYFWAGNAFNDFAGGDLVVSMQAYRTLRKAGGYEDVLKQVKKYFLMQDMYARNTLQSAMMLETFMEDKKFFAARTPKVIVDRQKETGDGTIEVSSKEPIQVDAKGEDFFVVYSEDVFEKDPDANYRVFNLKTELFQNGKRSDTVHSGKPVTMNITVEVKQNTSHVLVEVPIPGGFVQLNKSARHYMESEHEHFAEKSAFFIESLPKGTYTFTLTLVPKFEGIFTMLPAVVEDMYDPHIRGNNMKRSITVIK